MADARQKEMNVSITEVATKTLIAGRCRLSDGDDIEGISVHEFPVRLSRSAPCARAVHQCIAITDAIGGGVRATLVGPGLNVLVWQGVVTEEFVRSGPRRQESGRRVYSRLVR